MVPLLVGGVGVGLPAGFQRGAAGGRRRGSRVLLLQLLRVLSDGAPPADAPAETQAPDAAAAAAAAPGTGAAVPAVPAATPSNARTRIRRQRKSRKRRVRERTEEQAARICYKARLCESSLKCREGLGRRKRRILPESFEDRLQISCV